MSRQPGTSKAKRSRKGPEGAGSSPSANVRRRPSQGRAKVAVKGPAANASGYRLWVELALVGVAGLALQWFTGAKGQRG